MNLHTLTNVPGARTKKTRFGKGEGSGLGKTGGRGQKGQMARSGHKRKPGFEGGQMRLIRRMPKRGFKSVSRRVYCPVDVASLDAFDDGATITREALKAAGLARGQADGVKILGKGPLKRKFTVKAQAFSAGARSSIEAAGGTCEIVPSRGAPESARA